MCLVSEYKDFFDQKELQIKMFSVTPFSFNAVELWVVTINEKLWTRAREVCSALRYNKKKTANVVKNHCSKENYTQKYQMSGYTCGLAKGLTKAQYLHQYRRNVRAFVFKSTA